MNSAVKLPPTRVLLQKAFANKVASRISKDALSRVVKDQKDLVESLEMSEEDLKKKYTFKR